MDGLRVLVTAGGTREPIDSVRFIGNRSSGRMGFALADEAARRGAEVTVIAANVELPRNPVVAYEDVTTAAELKAASEARFGDCDVLLMAAAVADYRPAEAAGPKLKKEAAEDLDLRLERTDDALATLSAARRPGQTLVGFAAEHGEQAVALGRGKLERKGLDLVVVNDISRSDIGFDTAENEVTIVAAGAERPVPRASKAEVASAILDAVEQQRSAGEYNLKDGAPGAPGRPGAARA
jgi:phosphopantothenoylcysteine decarboxylase/phosphopantothenate--cysteine ligase